MNRVSAIASLVLVPLIGTIVPGAIALWTLPAAAQIVPDRSLGDEGSVLRQNVLRQGRLIDRIEGGATRGSLLFHSFRDFNVGVGDRVYFASPSGIANILSRVTGNSRSEILGRLGVDGSANLYLINPNGIVFGPSATLDIRGSFYASTADQIRLDNGWAFSATNPTAPPLLAVNLTPGLQRGGIATGSSLINQGNLAVGGDLTLAADRLDLYHQLSAGQTLSLYAQDTLRIRDSAMQPFIATSGGNTLLQGDRAVDISALSHPDSGLNAGGDLVLRSLTPITGDAHFSAGGSFRIEQLDGSLGELSSPNDPVIRAGGNVSFTDYTGASLHIFAGGSVSIGSVTITGPDVTNGINETVTLSDGSTVTISGNTQPTLDVRAGTRAVGSLLGLTGVSSPTGLNLGSSASSANITIGQITVTPANGLVFLTNQYQPDASLSGGTIRVGSIEVSNPAGSGSVVLDARDGIRLTGAVSAIATTGNGGDIRFLADGDINLESGFSMLSEGIAGGRIQIASGGDLTVQGLPADPNRSAILTTTTGDGIGGNLELVGRSVILNGTDVGTSLAATATGRGGDFTIRADNLFVNNVSTVVADTLGRGAGGRVLVNVAGNATVTDSFLGTVAVGDGDAGAVSFRGRSLTANNGGQFGSFTEGGGDAGDVTINARDFVAFDGFVTFQDLDGKVISLASGAFSSTDPDSSGSGGNLTVTAPQVILSNGAQLRVTTEGAGDPGNVVVNADSLSLDGAVFDPFLGIAPSAVVSQVLRESTGPGFGNRGNITFNVRSLSVTNGAFVSLSTESERPAGNLTVNASDSVTISGFISRSGSLDLPLFESVTQAGAPTEQRSGLFANTLPGSSGRGGSVIVNSGDVRLEDGGVIFIGSGGTGVGGDIRLGADTLVLDGDRSAIFTQTLTTDGGNIRLRVRDVIALRRTAQISASAGRLESAGATGNGGNIRINTRYLVAVDGEDSDITADAFFGNGGNINITAQGIFGITPRSEQTALSDITASSRFGIDGVITISEPDVDPSRGVVALPTEVIDASRLIAQGCAAGGTAAQSLGEFVVTGRGGLPPNPTERLGGEASLVGWESYDGSPAPAGMQSSQTGEPGAIATPLNTAVPGAAVDPAAPIVEAQSLLRRADGQVILAAHVPSLEASNALRSPGTCPAP